MRFFFICIFILFEFSTTIKAQAVFCPVGAEWYHTFTLTGFNPATFGNVQNHQTKYIKDSVVGPDTVKVLQHQRFFKQCNYALTPRTIIKQKGDTIFMRNGRTGNSWQILYNFAALPGNFWTNSFSDGMNAALKTYTITVDSVKYITVNSMLLKQLVVTYKFYHGQIITYESTKITERFGCERFIFNYYNHSLGICDYDNYSEFLCYQDSAFGLQQFTTKPCDYNITVGLHESKINNYRSKIYPNPTDDILNIALNNLPATETTIIKITDILGREVLQLQFSQQINIKELKTGIYFLQLYNKEKLIAVEKIVKE